MTPDPCATCRPIPGECDTCSCRPPTPPVPSDLLVKARLIADNLRSILPPPHPMMTTACEAAAEETDHA